MTEFRKRTALILIAVALIALVSGVYAYWKLNDRSQFSPATSTYSLYPLELRTELNKTAFLQGELIEVHAYLRNISNRTVRLTAWKGWFDFNITDADGAVVYQWFYYRGFAGPSIKILKPGVELNYTMKSDVFDEATISMVPLQLPKNSYKIIEFTSPLVVEYVEPAELIGELRLETPAITVTTI